MVIWYYGIVLLIVAIMTGSILIKNRKIDNAFVLFCILLTVDIAGQYMLAISDTLEAALFANIIMYVGGCYLPFVVFLVVTRLGNIKVHRYFKYLLLGIATGILGLVMSIGHNELYYVSVKLVHGNGYNYLVKQYGPLHVLYPAMMIFYSVMLIAVIVYAVREKKDIPTRTVVTMSVICTSVFLTYVFERLAGSKISYLPIGFLVGMMLLTRYFDRINMYDMSTIILSTVERMQEYGYIVIDRKCRYVSANDNVKVLFPEVKDWVVDKEIPVTDGGLYQNVICELLHTEREQRTNRTITVGDRYFEVDIRELMHRQKIFAGYLIEFIDRTAEWNYYNTIEEYNTKLEKEVEEKTGHISHIKDMMVLGIADLVGSRDSNTGGHIKRTSKVVHIFAEKLMECGTQFGLSKDFLKLVIKAAPMHDLGKVAIDDAVLRKPGKYTDAEYAEMKRHSKEGARIVESILQGVEEDAFVEVAKNVAYYHHEKWNGEGYPTGKSGAEIPPEARIMALADVFDALVSKRCYKEAFSYDEAFKIIEDSLGQHFDPELGRIFIGCRAELEAFYDKNK